MLKYKNKEGKVVMTENAETGEVKVFDEMLKELQEQHAIEDAPEDAPEVEPEVEPEKD